MDKLKPRQRRILQALKDCDGQATARQIALMTNLHVNGVAQSLGALAAKSLVALIEGEGGDTLWAYTPPD